MPAQLVGRADTLVAVGGEGQEVVEVPAPATWPAVRWPAGWRRRTSERLEDLEPLRERAITSGQERASAFDRDYTLAAIIAFSIFMLGAAVGHVRSMVRDHNFSPGNAGYIFWYDIFAPALLIVLFVLTA